MNEENLIPLTVRPERVKAGDKIYIKGNGLSAVSYIQIMNSRLTAHHDGDEYAATVSEDVKPGGWPVYALDPSNKQLGRGSVIVDE
ncbi:hypothetical protein [Pseudomonas sp. nanlin1]|uniref:hypothetical protein n=1 Tax=Pseudomonas sp. nanlin1 TaxID=3040605 RepID=UPI00388D2ABB